MRKLVYLIILLVLLLAGTLMLRKYHQSLPIPSILMPAAEEEDTVASDYLSANVAQRSGDIQGAIKYFEKALSKDAENNEIIQRLYGLYIFNGQYDLAIEHAKRQVEIDKSKATAPKDMDPISYLLVSLDKFKNKDVKAIAPLLEPVADPKIPNKTHIDGVMIPMVLVWSYVVDERYTDAFRVIDNITSDYMSSIFSYNRALINDIANNKKVLIEGKNYSPHERGERLLSDVFFEIGKYSLQSGNLEESVVYLRLARFLNPDSYKLKKILAVAFESMGKLKEALAIYNEIPESSENYGETLLSIALLNHGMEDDAKAIQTLERLKGISGYEYKAIFGMGTIKMSENKYDEAIKYFEEAISKIEKPAKEDWNIFFNLGVAYEKKDNWDKAEEYLKRSVQLYPENPESLNYLAYSWIIRNKNIKQARAMLEAAVIRSGGAPHILDSYGWALFKLGYYKEAIPFLEQASNGMSYSTVINDHLGDVYWKAGRKREAKFQWKKALDAFDKDQDLTPEITKEQLQKKIDSGLE